MPESIGQGQRQRRWWSRWLGTYERLAGVHDARALALLKRCLSRVQLQQFEHQGAFDVIGGDTGRRYRVLDGRIMNVQLFDRGGWRTCFCFEPQGRLPIGDVLLAQKFALELFETEALNTANRSSPHRTFWMHSRPGPHNNTVGGRD
jgi:hypothetical protein